MRKKAINISIPSPCSQSVNKMQRTENGYFCSACQTEVIDYRSVSDQTLAESLKARKEKGVKPCGIFRADQLNRPVYQQQTGCSGFSNTWKALGVMAGLTLASAPGTLQAQMTTEDSIIMTIENQHFLPLKLEVPVKSDVPARGRYMSGRVIRGGEYSGPIRHATVQFKEAGVSVRTDKNGYFKLFLPDDYTFPEVTLVAFKIHRKYLLQEMKLQSTAMPAEGLIITLMMPEKEPELIVVGAYVD